MKYTPEADFHSLTRMQILSNEKIRGSIDAELKLAMIVNYLIETHQASEHASIIVHPPSDELVLQLLEKGFDLPQGLTQKQAFDLQGLFCQASQKQQKVLRFFGVDNWKDFNRTAAQRVIKKLLVDSPDGHRWYEQPLTIAQQQGILFLTGRLPAADTTYRQAMTLIDGYRAQDPRKHAEWQQIKHLYAQANIISKLEYYRCRKISWKRFFALYAELKNEGFKPYEMTGDIFIQRAILGSSRRKKA